MRRSAAAAAAVVSPAHDVKHVVIVDREHAVVDVFVL